MFEIAVQRVSFRHFEFRERFFDFVELEIAAFGNGHGAGKDIRTVFKDKRHLFCGLHKELIALEFQPVRLMNGLAGLHAHQNVLGVSIVLTEIVAVIGGHHRHGQFFFQAEEISMDAMLLRQSLVLDFQKEVVFAEDLPEISGSIAGRFAAASPWWLRPRCRCRTPASARRRSR